MKFLLLLLLLPFTGLAQKMEENLPPKAFNVDAKPAPIYSSAADTANKAKEYLKNNTEVLVVGEFSPRWAIIKKEGILYLIPARQLIMYSYYQSTREADKRLAEIYKRAESDTSTSSTGRGYHVGPRGGHYYINGNGNKTYIKRK